LRYIKTAEELKGYHPLWINNYFLKKAELKDGKLVCGDAEFSSLYIDNEYIDSDALNTILDLAKKGLPICLKRLPKEPGKIKSGSYQQRLTELSRLKNVVTEFKNIKTVAPLIEGKNIPDFWCKKVDGDYFIFFSYPLAQNLHFPISYGQSLNPKEISRKIKVNANQNSVSVNLVFKPNQSLLLKIDKNNKVEFIDITYEPPVPVVKEGE